MFTEITTFLPLITSEPLPVPHASSVLPSRSACAAGSACDGLLASHTPAPNCQQHQRRPLRHPRLPPCAKQLLRDRMIVGLWQCGRCADRTCDMGTHRSEKPMTQRKHSHNRSLLGAETLNSIGSRPPLSSNVNFYMIKTTRQFKLTYTDRSNLHRALQVQYTNAARCPC